MKKSMKKVLPTLFCCYILFRFYPLVINVALQKLIGFICISIYVVWNILTVVNTVERKRLYVNLFIVVLFILITLAVPIIHGTYDFSYVATIPGACFTLVCWLAFSIHVKKTAQTANDGDIEFTIADELGRVMFLYVLFTIFCIFSPDFADTWKSFISMNEYDVALLENFAGYSGRIGWNGFAGMGATFMCSLSVFFCCAVLFSDKKTKYRERYRPKIFIYLMVSIIGNFFYGRVGTIASIAVLGLFIVFNMFKLGKWKLLFGILFLLVIVFVVANVLKDRVEVISYIYKWSFEPLLNYLSEKDFSSSSSDRLFEMWDIQINFSTFLFGDGRYSSMSGIGYYKSVDPGPLRFILYWGIFPTILIYIFTVNLIFRSFFGKQSAYFMIIFLLMEFKGEMCWHVMLIYVALQLLGINPHRKRKLVFRLKEHN